MPDPWMLPARMSRAAPRNTKKRSHPEQSLQIHVAELLGWLLPPEIPWTAIGHGGGGKMRGMILKGMGVHAGWPDLMLIYAGRPYFIELKAGSSVSPAQKIVLPAIQAAGGHIAVCRSIEAVRDSLLHWGIPTRERKPSAEAFRQATLRQAD